MERFRHGSHGLIHIRMIVHVSNRTPKNTVTHRSLRWAGVSPSAAPSLEYFSLRF